MDTHNFLLCMVALCNTCTCHFNSHVVSALNDSGSSENLIARAVRIRCTCRSPAHPLARANSLINKLAVRCDILKGFIVLSVNESVWRLERRSGRGKEGLRKTEEMFAKNGESERG